MCPLLVYCKISNWMVKVIKLPCTFSMVLRIQYQKMFVFDYKSISERMYCEVRGNIPNFFNRLLHGTVFLYPITILPIFFLNFKYFFAAGWFTTTTQYPHMQGVSRLVDIPAGVNFLGLCAQNSSYKHCPILDGYGVLGRF